MLTNNACRLPLLFQLMPRLTATFSRWPFKVVWPFASLIFQEKKRMIQNFILDPFVNNFVSSLEEQLFVVDANEANI